MSQISSLYSYWNPVVGIKLAYFTSFNLSVYTDNEFIEHSAAVAYIFLPYADLIHNISVSIMYVLHK